MYQFGILVLLSGAELIGFNVPTGSKVESCRARSCHFAVKPLKIISLEGGRARAALKITVDQVPGGTDVFFHARSSWNHINALEAQLKMFPV